MAKLYGFSVRKYGHNIEFALLRLKHMAYDAEREGKQAQADYYWNKFDTLQKRYYYTGKAGYNVNYYPYETWRYLMTVKDWAVANGSGTGYL